MKSRALTKRSKCKCNTKNGYTHTHTHIYIFYLQTKTDLHLSIPAASLGQHAWDMKITTGILTICLVINLTY